MYGIPSTDEKGANTGRNVLELAARIALHGVPLLARKGRGVKGSNALPTC